MKILNVRNVHEALPKALSYIYHGGDYRNSRNGPVLQSPYPVTTVYSHPLENVIFWPERDANPFFHLYEALWMLDGRNDVAPLERYVKNSINFSDDGKTLHGAYGYRWRRQFGDLKQSECGLGNYSEWSGIDQLTIIAERLKKDPEDRRCVLQMWDTVLDLNKNGKDVPCNTIATFQRNRKGELDLVVFNRSNDIIWGCYGANAVQFSFLLEYMALKIGCPVGTYSQVSVNWHVYDNDLCKKIKVILNETHFRANPYETNQVRHIPMRVNSSDIDTVIKNLLISADTGNWGEVQLEREEWPNMVQSVLYSHHMYKTIKSSPEKYEAALEVLGGGGDQKADWIVASQQWIQRRYDAWKIHADND